MTAQPAVQCLAWDHASLAGIRRAISADVRRYLVNYPELSGGWISVKRFLGVFLTPEILCVSIYRASHFLYLNRWRRMAYFVSALNTFLNKASLPPQACVGPGFHLPHPAGVVFCGTAGRDLALYSTAVCSPTERFAEGPVEASPHLGDRVTVGAHAVLLGPIQIGDDTHIGFSVRLTSDVPARTTVVSAAQRNYVAQ